MRTFTPKPGDVERSWYVIDANDVAIRNEPAIQRIVLELVSVYLSSQERITVAGREDQKIAPLTKSWLAQLTAWTY